MHFDIRLEWLLINKERSKISVENGCQTELVNLYLSLLFQKNPPGRTQVFYFANHHIWYALNIQTVSIKQTQIFIN